MHGTDDAKVVRMFPKMMKDLADGDPALPVPLEGEGRREGPTGLAFGLEVNGNSLARIFPQDGLGVKSIDLGGSTIAEDVNDVLGLGMKMGGEGLKGIAHSIPDPEQAEPEEAHSHPRGSKKVSAAESCLHDLVDVEEFIAHEHDLGQRIPTGEGRPILPR